MWDLILSFWNSDICCLMVIYTNLSKASFLPSDSPRETAFKENLSLFLYLIRVCCKWPNEIQNTLFSLTAQRVLGFINGRVRRITCSKKEKKMNDTAIPGLRLTVRYLDVPPSQPSLHVENEHIREKAKGQIRWDTGRLIDSFIGKCFYHFPCIAKQQLWGGETSSNCSVNSSFFQCAFSWFEKHAGAANCPVRWRI